MTWKVRHEGSPRSIDGLTFEQVLGGLQDGQWEPTDEVIGPDDRDWVAIENHPQLAEAAADIEPPPPRHYDDETRLDMNALIDVTLVLLIFFIMTATYAALQKRLEAANVSSEKPGVPVLTQKEVSDQMIYVTIRLEDGDAVVRVENKVTPPEKLVAELSRFVGGTGRTRMLLDYEPKVPWEDVIRVQDDAKAAGINRISMRVP